MLHLVLSCILAAVLVAAAGAKLARPAESRAALRGLAPRVPFALVVGLAVVVAAVALLTRLGRRP